MFRNLFVLLCLAGIPAAFGQTPVIKAVVSAADYSPRPTPGNWVAIFGTNLAPAEKVRTTLPLPMELGGVSATIQLRGFSGKYQMPLRYVSPTQINVLIPSEVGTGYCIFAVTTPAGTSADFVIAVSTQAYALYTRNGSGTGPALAFDANFQPVTGPPQGPIVLYASGLGPTDPPATADGGNASEPLNRVRIPFGVRMGGVLAQVLFAGLAPGLPGVYQINVLPPAGLAGNSLTVGDVIATLPAASPVNTANVTGAITPSYPLPSTELTYSAELIAASFKTAFDILPGAKPFEVAASCGKAAMTVAFDPAAGTWTAKSNVPPAAQRSGDFSHGTAADGAPLGVIQDYTYNAPFPGNYVHSFRWDPEATKALSSVPLPNFEGTAADVNYTATGSIPPGGHFVIDSSTNAGVANFGGYVNALTLGRGGIWYRSSVCKLIVDGMVVDSNNTTFH